MDLNRDAPEPLADPDLIRHAIVVGNARWAGRLTEEWAHRCRSLGYLRPQLLLAIRAGDADRAALCARLIWVAAQRDAELKARYFAPRQERRVLRFPTAVREIAEEFAGMSTMLEPAQSRRPTLEELDGDNTEDRLYE